MRSGGFVVGVAMNTHTTGRADPVVLHFPVSDADTAPGCPGHRRGAGVCLDGASVSEAGSVIAVLAARRDQRRWPVSAAATKQGPDGRLRLSCSTSSTRTRRRCLLPEGEHPVGGLARSSPTARCTLARGQRDGVLISPIPTAVTVHPEKSRISPGPSCPGAASASAGVVGPGVARVAALGMAGPTGASVLPFDDASRPAVGPDQPGGGPPHAPRR